MKNLIFATIIFQILSCSQEVKNNDSIVVYDDSILNIIDKQAEIEYLVDSLSVAEGPL